MIETLVLTIVWLARIRFDSGDYQNFNSALYSVLREVSEQATPYFETKGEK